MSSNDYLILGSIVFFFWVIPSLLIIGYGFKLTNKMKWKIIAIGLLTPWFIGSLIKIYLDLQNKITFAWSYFLNPEGLVVFIPASIAWGIPFIALGFLSRQLMNKDFLRIQSERGKFYLLMGTLTGAFIGASRIFISAFSYFDAIVILMPVWILYVPELLIGLLIGWLIGRRIDSKIKNKAKMD